jgi:hypothetical protein
MPRVMSITICRSLLAEFLLTVTLPSGMASFYAELLAGATYPVRSCTYEFAQTTNERGQVVAKVRHSLVQLTLNVPDDDLLLDWANTPFMPLAGQVVFYNAKGGPVLETLVWEAGQCIGYREDFEQGNATLGAYVCHLTIAAPKLTMQPGSLAANAAPTLGEHAGPAQALLNPTPLVVPPTPLVLPTVEELGVAALEGLAAAGAAVATPIALTVGLILGTATPAHAPGIPQTHLLPINPKQLRLTELETGYAAGSLSAAEEAELLTLLGEVRGVHLGSLTDLPAYYAQRPAELALAAKLEPPAKYHSINSITSKSRFGGGNRTTPKTIAKGHVNLQADFAEIQAGNAAYDKHSQTFTTTAGRVYGFHADHITSKGSSPIYPIRGNPGDFVNVTQAEFDILRKMPDNQGLNGPALQELQGLLRAGNPGVDEDTEAKLVDLFTSRQP